MSDSSLRRSHRLIDQLRIDYREYHRTGKKVQKASGDRKMAKQEDIILQLGVLAEDIADHLDENLVASFLVVEDIDNSVSKLESLRSEYRSCSQYLKKHVGNDKYLEEYNSDHENTLNEIKCHIMAAKEKKKSLRESEVNIKDQERMMKENRDRDENVRNTKAANFIWAEVNRMMNELTAEFSKHVDVCNDEIVRRKDYLSETLLLLDRLSSNFKNFLEVIPDNYPNKNRVINELNNRYDAVIELKINYVKQLNEEIERREITKERSFQTSNLNIKLEKFKGYASDTDIYSFQSNFEKLHLKGTPTAMLPDLLKNNYLSNPALALVKSLDDIDEIWKRLHKAYGDPKVMLRKKLSDVSKIGPLFKLKEAEDLKNGLMNLINTMADLIKLSKKHKIEQKLYHGEGLHIIYRLMGDARVTRWLSSISEEELDEAELWERLMKYLEKELHVQQEKSLINYNVFETFDPPFKPPSKPKSPAHFTNHESENKLRFSFCNEKGHVSTNGPYGSFLIQYFSCKKFVDLNPGQRFRELRIKGLCCQCLYPGAKQAEGKHVAGRCQSVFACKHKNHERYPVKKHVLVCQEHSSSDDNTKLLNEYKSECILGQKAPLENFSKEIKVSLHSYISSHKTEYSNPHPNDDDVVADDGIYILQTILVNHVPVTMFFDTGCSDFVCRFNAVEKIGQNAIQEFQGPINLGGVGETTAISKHGVYQVRLPLYGFSRHVVSTG